MDCKTFLDLTDLVTTDEQSKTQLLSETKTSYDHDNFNPWMDNIGIDCVVLKAEQENVWDVRVKKIQRKSARTRRRAVRAGSPIWRES